ADMHGRVGHLHMQRIAIGVRIDGDRAQAHAPCRLDDATGDLAAVGDEEGGEHGLGRYLAGPGPKAARLPPSPGRVTSPRLELRYPPRGGECGLWRDPTRRRRGEGGLWRDGAVSSTLPRCGEGSEAASIAS